MRPSPIILDDTPTPSPHLLTLLQSHLPHSLPVLRRLQFAVNFSTAGGSTPHTHVLYARAQDQDQEKNKGHFAAAYVDLSRAPETQVWVYSSLERQSDNNDDDNKEEEEEEEAALDLVLAILKRIRAIAIAGAGDWSILVPLPGPPGGGSQKRRILVGTLHETVRQGLLARGVRMDKAPGVPAELDWEFCGKWLFRLEDLPVSDGGGGGGGSNSLPCGMRWDRVRKGDVGVVLGRTNIKRQEATLLMLPSTVVRLDDGSPVAWAFMGLDGTIITLHVEEPYRRLGIAKALACKLMLEHLPEYGDDGWGAADVFVENHKSQAMCRSIGGKLSWTLSWARIDISSVGDPI